MLQYKLLNILIKKYPKLFTKLTGISIYMLRSWVNNKMRKERLKKSKLKDRRNKDMKFREFLVKVKEKVASAARAVVDFLKPTAKEIADSVVRESVILISNEGREVISDILPVIKDKVEAVALDGKDGNEAFKEVYDYSKDVIESAGKVVASSLIKFVIEYAYNLFKGRL